MTHPIPHRPLSSIRFCPFQDILTVGHSAGLSSLLVPGAGEPNFDSGEADPFEGRNARREREVRVLLDKLAPDTIVLDPEIIGGVAEGAQHGLGTEGVAEAYRKLPRLERLRVSGKADESEVVDPLDAKVDEEGGEGFIGLSEKERKAKREEAKERMRKRGKDKSMKRFLKKKRANVLDPATVRVSFLSAWTL
jgi:U3 small nucleolar RNA-associated protein 7